MRRRVAVGLGAAAGFLALVGCLYIGVIAVTVDLSAYPQVPPFDVMARELVDYLMESRPALSEGLFTEQERLHMEDVLRLYQAGKWIGIGGFLLGGACGVAGIFVSGRRAAGKGIFIGLAAFLAVLLAMGAWVLMDFSGWFVRMHELVFDNDLWLFDPAESMLIRMMPTAFFERAVRLIGACLLCACALESLLALAFLHTGLRKERSWDTDKMSPRE